MAQKEITPGIVQQLLKDQITDEITGFTSKAGKLFNAKLKVVGGEVKFEFGN